jgi:hypothetical protein
MSTKQTSRRRRRKTVNRPKAAPAQHVQEVLLELTYRLHVTRPVAYLQRVAGSVA